MSLRQAEETSDAEIEVLHPIAAQLPPRSGSSGCWGSAARRPLLPSSLTRHAAFGTITLFPLLLLSVAL